MADGLAEEVRLVRECRLGKSEAFGPLVAHYQNAAYATARGFVRNHQDAQDVVQEAFIAAYCRLGQLREPAKFGSWLRAIVATRSQQWLRQRRQRGRMLSLEHAAGNLARTAGPTHERQEAQQELWDEVEQLPEKLRTVVLLHYLSGWSYAQIARFLELPESTITGRLQQSRLRLRQALSPAELEEVEMTRIDVREEVQEVVCKIATEPIEERIPLEGTEHIALYCGLDVDVEIRPGEDDALVLEGNKTAFGRSPEAARESLEKIEILNDRVEDFVESGPHPGEVFTGTNTDEDGNLIACSASTGELWEGYIRGEEYRMWGLKWETPFPFLEGKNTLPPETVERLQNCARVSIVKQKMEDIVLPSEALTPELQKVFRPNSTNPERVHGSIGFVKLIAYLPPGRSLTVYKGGYVEVKGVRGCVNLVETKGAEVEDVEGEVYLQNTPLQTARKVRGKLWQRHHNYGGAYWHGGTGMVDRKVKRSVDWATKLEEVRGEVRIDVGCVAIEATGLGGDVAIDNRHGETRLHHLRHADGDRIRLASGSGKIALLLGEEVIDRASLTIHGLCGPIDFGAIAERAKQRSNDTQGIFISTFTKPRDPREADVYLKSESGEIVVEKME